MSKRAGRLATAGSGLNKVAGYGVSMLVLALASLAIIPVMVAADGPTAWASIAVGQSIGGVAAVAIGYGWGLTGPAVIARADSRERVRAHGESLRVKTLLLLPLGAAAALVAALLAPGRAELAMAGALSMAMVGLSAGWYFVGLSRPYAMFLLETLPRVLGVVVGIVLMLMGAGAFVGVLCQMAGVLAGFVISSIYIQGSRWTHRTDHLSSRPLRLVLASQGLGVSSTLLSASYVAAPILIVSAVAPFVLPVFAIVDKVQRQVSVALNPFVTVFQGWVPRVDGGRLHQRVQQALLLSALFSTLLGAGMLFVAPHLILWLGGAQIHPSYPTLVLMSVFAGLNLFESVVSKAVLVAIDRVNVVATATLLGTIIGLPLVVLGAVFFGSSGALAGILSGLVVRLVIELLNVLRFFKSSNDVENQPEGPRRPEREYL